MSNEAKHTENNEAIELKTTTINLMEVDQVKAFVATELLKFKADFSAEFLEDEPTPEQLEQQANEEKEFLRSIVADEVKRQVSELLGYIENTVNDQLRKHGLIKTLEAIAPEPIQTKTETKKRIKKKR